MVQQWAPVIGAGDQASGAFEVVTNWAASNLDYNVTSLKVVAHAAPEIDPASTASGLTLVLGGLAVLQGRRSRKLQVAVAAKAKT